MGVLIGQNVCRLLALTQETFDCTRSGAKDSVHSAATTKQSRLFIWFSVRIKAIQSLKPTGINQNINKRERYGAPLLYAPGSEASHITITWQSEKPDILPFCGMYAIHNHFDIVLFDH